MLHPSYSDLMKVVNSGVEEGETPVVNSRYSIVMATAKRARQILSLIHIYYSAFLQEYGVISEALPAADCYTNEFLQ